jgi:hypothetical protein
LAANNRGDRTASISVCDHIALNDPCGRAAWTNRGFAANGRSYA